MSEQQRVAIESQTVLWQSGAVVCTCVRHADRITIQVTDAGALVDRAEFADSYPAAEYAIAKMHAFQRR